MVLRVLYIALLTVLAFVWAAEDFVQITSCGRGFIYTEAWSCRLLNSILDSVFDADHGYLVLFLSPWIFLIIYGFRRFKKYNILKLEHCLIAGLFFMYIWYFVTLVLSGYNG